MIMMTAYVYEYENGLYIYIYIYIYVYEDDLLYMIKMTAHYELKAQV